MTQHIVVFVTAGSEAEAETIAKALAQTGMHAIVVEEDDRWAEW